MKFEIKSRYDASLLFSLECDSFRICVEAAVKSGANLSGADLSVADLSGADLSGANLSVADLSRANLYGANLSGADLSGADLSGANLYGADLSRANLSRADLSGADLSGANLSGADLYGANLSGADLYGEKVEKILQVGPIGSRASYLVAFKTDVGIKIKAGCFFGPCDDFLKAVKEKHGKTEHAKAYGLAVKFIKAYFGVGKKIAAMKEQKK